MVTHSARTLSSALVVCALFGAAAHAQSVNDHWSGRRLIASLPYSFNETTVEGSTVDATDPPAPCRTPSQNATGATLWYGYTSGSTTEYLTVETGNLSFFGNVAVYTGTPGAFRAVSGGCSIRGNFGDRPRIVGMRVLPNTPISIVVSSDFPFDPGQVLPFSVAATPVVNVTKTEDTFDGICDADCSLREAVSHANGSASVVLIPAGTYTLTRAGVEDQDNATGDLDLRASMAMFGAGPQQTIIDAAGIDRVLDIDANGNCCHQYALGDFRITNGRAFLSPAGSERNGAGLRAESSYCYIGMERIQIDHNSAESSGGGVYQFCAGTMRQVVIASNSGNQYGGGIYYFDSPQRFLAIEESEIAANEAVVGAGIQAQGRLLVSNSTIHHNLARIGGGGINQGNHRMVLANSTVMYNRGSDNAFATTPGGGIRLEAGSGNLIINSVIARNTTANPNVDADCAVLSSNFTSRYTHVGAPGACAFAGVGDVTGSDPGLATAIANNGGASGTFAVPITAAVLDAGDPAGCLDALGLPLANDQRGAGYPRPLGTACDKGAFERSPLAAPGVPDLANASDSGASDDDNITNIVQVQISGTCQDATTIRLYDGVQWLGATLCTSSAYAITPALPLSEGDHAIVADASDGVSTSTRSEALTVTVDLTAPAAPTILGPGESEPLTITMTGNAAEALGSIVIRRASETVCTAPVTPSATWLCATTFSAPGFYTIDATQIDRAGNAGAPSAPFVIHAGDVLFEDGFDA